MPIIEAAPESLLAFDTSVFTHLRKNQPYVQKRLRHYFADTQRSPALPAMTIFEAKWGIEKEFAGNKISAAEYEMFVARLNELISVHQVLPFDQKAAEIASIVYARLSKSDQNKHWEDLFVMATAIAHNHGLITQNVRDANLLANHLPENTYLTLAVWKP